MKLVWLIPKSGMFFGVFDISGKLEEEQSHQKLSRGTQKALESLKLKKSSDKKTPKEEIIEESAEHNLQENESDEKFLLQKRSFSFGRSKKQQLSKSPKKRKKKSRTISDKFSHNRKNSSEECKNKLLTEFFLTVLTVCSRKN